MRKPMADKNFSIENFYYELFKDFKYKNFKVEFKVCPLKTQGILNRIFLCIWAYFNQGSINHICGDINFISILMNKNKTINTFLDFYSMKRLKGFKKLIYYIFWIMIPFFKSRKVITISNNTFNELKNLVKIRNKKDIHVIGVSISSGFKKKFKKRVNKNPKILVVGTAINKNIINIILSLKKISCSLVLIGKLNDEIIEKLSQTNIDYKNLVSINKRKLIGEYINCDIVLFPSNYEGFGMPILEAQSIGRPLITSKIEPMKSVAGNAAVFVNPKKIKEITRAVNLVIKNQRLRNSLIKKGFINIKRFQKEIILKQHLRVYSKITTY